MAGIDSYTKLMLHMNGTDGSTTFTDSSLSPHTMTAYGNAQISTSQYKFGGASGRCYNGVSYLTTPSNSDFAYDADFTVDFWCYIPNQPEDYYIIMANQTSGGLSIGVHSSYGFFMGRSLIDIQLHGTSPISTGAWHHCAVVRSGTTVKIFTDGTQTASGTITTSYNQGILVIGVDGNLIDFPYVGWLDEFRISKGIARWTSNFTPPTEEYTPPPTGGNDSYTKSLLHMNGTDGSTTFTDSAVGGSHTWTAHGDAQIDTAGYKFGGAGGLFDGNGDYLTTPDSEDFEFASYDFTIDFWYKAISTASNFGIYSRKTASGIGPDGNNVAIMDNGTNIVVYVYGTDNNPILSAASFGARSTTEFVHYALVRSGSNWRTYRNGVYVTEVTSTLGIHDSDSTSVSIGEYANQFLHGWLDEVRISKGIARWTSNFTPPVIEYFVLGWTKTIMGVNTPASIMGIPNDGTIKSVMGVT
jgi:hypothetical protein